jgi:hypothetical protein
VGQRAMYKEVIVCFYWMFWRLFVTTSDVNQCRTWFWQRKWKQEKVGLLTHNKITCMYWLWITLWREQTETRGTCYQCTYKLTYIGDDYSFCGANVICSTILCHTDMCFATGSIPYSYEVYFLSYVLKLVLSYVDTQTYVKMGKTAQPAY